MCAVGQKKTMHTLSNLQTNQGDSGSPIWMYHMGRTYQIGIHSTIVQDEEGCGGPQTAVQVPYYMD